MSDVKWHSGLKSTGRDETATNDEKEVRKSSRREMSQVRASFCASSEFGSARSRVSVKGLGSEARIGGRGGRSSCLSWARWSLARSRRCNVRVVSAEGSLRHLVVRARWHKVIASDLTSKSATDASRVPVLAKQLERPLGSVCADGAYDTEGVNKAVENHTKDRSPRVLTPPKKNAQVRRVTSTTRERNRNIRSRARRDKRQWHKRSGYSRRSMVENTFYRYKTIIGPTMRSRTLQGQRVESSVGCRILNRMAALGMPESRSMD